MARSIYEGGKELIEVQITRRRGSDPITLTTPERRILDSGRALVSGFDWTACQWDETNAILSALFDSTATGLTVPGLYYMQLRGVIGNERYEAEVPVTVKDWGPS